MKSYKASMQLWINLKRVSQVWCGLCTHLAAVVLSERIPARGDRRDGGVFSGGVHPALHSPVPGLR